jgi:hypothetical protein
MTDTATTAIAALAVLAALAASLPVMDTVEPVSGALPGTLLRPFPGSW